MAAKEAISIPLETGKGGDFYKALATLLWESASEKARANVAERMLLLMPVTAKMVAEISDIAKDAAAASIADELTDKVREQLKEPGTVFDDIVEQGKESARKKVQNIIDGTIERRVASYASSCVLPEEELVSMVRSAMLKAVGELSGTHFRALRERLESKLKESA